jgi:hypothetical protein
VPLPTLTQDEIRAEAARIVRCIDTAEEERRAALTPTDVLSILSFVAAAVLVVGANEYGISPDTPCEAFITAFREQVKVMTAGETSRETN